MSIPRVRLRATDGVEHDIAEETSGTAVVYVYPQTGVPGVEMPAGWDAIPGARGCTPQACSYRDDFSSYQEMGVDVFGLSTQAADAQREFATREHIPFPLLSDPERRVGRVLGLPTFTVGGQMLYRRVTLIIEGGKVTHVRYPVFPPNEDAWETLSWLRSRRAPTGGGRQSQDNGVNVAEAATAVGDG